MNKMVEREVFAGVRTGARESKVPESRHTNLIEPHWKGQEINAARQFNA